MLIVIKQFNDNENTFDSYHFRFIINDMVLSHDSSKTFKEYSKEHRLGFKWSQQ